ncbi:MAG: class II glutamine amidotransferase [Pseudomonadota bacterium]
MLTPAHSLIDQSQAATESKIAVNGDGYGFAWYADDGRLGLFKDVLPAWGDGNLANLGAMIESTLILAHVRASTYGAVSRSNCHPFKVGHWSFMHNGQIGEFARYRRQLETLLSDDMYQLRTGNTDSELLFLLLLEYGLKDDVTAACARVIERLQQITDQSCKPNRITAVFSDGTRLFALRHSTDNKSPTLYIKRATNQGLVIASEPLDPDLASWIPVAENCLVEASGGSPVVTRISSLCGSADAGRAAVSA